MGRRHWFPSVGDTLLTIGACVALVLFVARAIDMFIALAWWYAGHLTLPFGEALSLNSVRGLLLEVPEGLGLVEPPTYVATVTDPKGGR